MDFLGSIEMFQLVLSSAETDEVKAVSAADITL